MSTDIYVAVSSKIQSKEIINRDIDKCITMFQEFDTKYSRFKADNDLYALNTMEDSVVSSELFEMLELGKKYYTETNGIFDLAVKNALENEGYVYSILEQPNFSSVPVKDIVKYTFDQVVLNKVALRCIKPFGLQIDLGGIGKGFIVDKVAGFLKQKYSDFCVNAGGDIFVSGRDTNKDYKYWAIDIENPFTNNSSEDMPLIMLTNMAIATSGINTRKWVNDGNEKNHLIDPRTGKSIINDLMCVSVIGDSTTYCDVYAKYLLILGLEKGLEYCQNSNVAAIFITKDCNVYSSKKAETYVWKEKL